VCHVSYEVFKGHRIYNFMIELLLLRLIYHSNRLWNNNPFIRPYM